MKAKLINEKKYEEPNIYRLNYNYDEDPAEIGQLFKETLEQMGIYMYEDPNAEATDIYAYILSDQPLSKDYIEENFGD